MFSGEPLPSGWIAAFLLVAVLGMGAKLAIVANAVRNRAHAYRGALIPLVVGLSGLLAGGLAYGGQVLSTAHVAQVSVEAMAASSIGAAASSLVQTALLATGVAALLIYLAVVLGAVSHRPARWVVLHKGG